MKTISKLSTMLIMSVIGTNVLAFCPSGPTFWQCWEQEMAQQRQQTQMNNIQHELEEIRNNQRFSPRQCFRDYFGNVQCY